MVPTPRVHTGMLLTVTLLKGLPTQHASAAYGSYMMVSLATGLLNSWPAPACTNPIFAGRLPTITVCTRRPLNSSQPSVTAESFSHVSGRMYVQYNTSPPLSTLCLPQGRGFCSGSWIREQRCRA